jgi:hypothetical protein
LTTTGTPGAADEAALRDLYARACWCMDEADGDRYAQLWTTDGVFSQRNGTESFPMGSDVVGRDALARACRKFSFQRPPHQHWLNHVWFDGFDGTAISGHASVLVLQRSGRGGGDVVAAGKYDDRLVRVDQVWLFDRRTISFTF